MAKDGGGFDFSAINGSMAKQLVKDMLAAFDADTNRKRLAKAILAARDTLAFTPSAGRRECAMQAFVRDAGGKDAVRWGDQAGLVSFTFNTSMQFSYQKLPKVFSFDP